MRFEPKIPQEMYRQLERLGQVDDIAPKMLAAGAIPVADNMRKRVNSHSRTGEMAGSISIRPVRKLKKGGYSQAIQFWGYDKKRKPTPGYPRGVPNAVKAAGIEYGNAHQAAEPFMEATAAESKDAAAAAMQQVFEKEAVP